MDNIVPLESLLAGGYVVTETVGKYFFMKKGDDKILYSTERKKVYGLDRPFQLSYLKENKDDSKSNNTIASMLKDSKRELKKTFQGGF